MRMFALSSRLPSAKTKGSFQHGNNIHKCRICPLMSPTLVHNVNVCFEVPYFWNCVLSYLIGSIFFANATSGRVESQWKEVKMLFIPKIHLRKKEERRKTRWENNINPELIIFTELKEAGAMLILKAKELSVSRHTNNSGFGGNNCTLLWTVTHGLIWANEELRATIMVTEVDPAGLNLIGQGIPHLKLLAMLMMKPLLIDCWRYYWKSMRLLIGRGKHWWDWIGYQEHRQ